MPNDPLQKYETSTMSPARSRIKNAGSALDRPARPARTRRLWLILVLVTIIIIGLAIAYAIKK